MRDFGPSFLTDGKSLKVADFGFNYWGYDSAEAKASKEQDAVDRFVAQRLRIPAQRFDLISEGGNRESNGKGVIMLTEAVERQRNPSLSREELEAKLKVAMNAKVILWLPKGVMEDGYSFDGPIDGNIYLPITTGGHVDNFARFIDARTILLAEVTEEEAKRSGVARENRKRLEAARQAIEAARDQDGNPFRILRVPAPELVTEMMRPGDPVYDFLAGLNYPNGHKFPKGQPVRVAQANSYANFLITNKLVLGSRFWHPGLSSRVLEKDRRALAALRKAFPNHKVVLIPTRAVNLGGGGIHCITAHEPKVVP
jgi:agmatine deiminase